MKMTFIRVLGFAFAFVWTSARAEGGGSSRSSVELTRKRMKHLVTQLESFKKDCGFYPATADGFDALISKQAANRVGCAEYRSGGYLKKRPLDAWKKNFGYRSDGKTYEIFSFGADGIPDGDGSDADIYSKDLSPLL